MLNRIVTRLNQKDVKVKVTPDNIVWVVNDATARRMRVILIRENLIPFGEPLHKFDKEP
jgi:flagellar M-ring protein FliF